MADIFISYTSSDRDWAFWIAHELEALGHVAHVHEWEVSGGDDIYAWMERRHNTADHVLCVVSDDYLKAPYSTLERNAALWHAVAKRPGFVLLVAVLAHAALSAHEKAFGQHHRLTKKSAHVTTKALDALGRGEAATTLRHRYGIEDIGKPN
jgi:TIR domain